MNDGNCSSCGAELGWAEPDPCGSCVEPRRWNEPSTDRLYQVLCGLDLRPARIADLHRVARAESRDGVSDYSYSQNTANVYVPRDPRFCWAGRGIYGLTRDGLIAGPRKLTEVAALVMLAVDEPWSRVDLEFVMKRLGYRFQLQSLVNAMDYSPWFSRVGWTGTFAVGRTQEDRRNYQRAIAVSCTFARFDADMEKLSGRVTDLLEERTRLQSSAPDLQHLDDDWAPGR